MKKLRLSATQRVQCQNGMHDTLSQKERKMKEGKQKRRIPMTTTKGQEDQWVIICPSS